MRLVTMSLVALVFLLTDVAEAQGVRWATSFDDALKEAKERGVLILCVFNTDEGADPDNLNMIQLLSSSKAVHKACRKFVCVWANKDRHREVKKRVDGKMRSVCPHLGNAPCRVHVEMESIVVRRFGDVMISDDGYVKAPCQWLIDGDGEVVETIVTGDRNGGFGAVAEGEFVMRLEAAAKKHGRGLTSDEYHKLRLLIEEGNKLKAAGDYAAAAGKFRQVVKTAPPKVSSVETARAALAEIAALGRKGIEEADALSKEEKYAEALARLEEVARVFKGSDAESEAKDRLKELKKNPVVARMLRDSASLRASKRLLAAGQAAEKAENWRKALEAYKGCAQKYPDTPAGKAAKERLEALMADPKIGAAIREAAAAKDCKSWLNLARNFISNNLPDRARVYLRKVLDKYPGTSYATQAQKLLDGLK